MIGSICTWILLMLFIIQSHCALGTYECRKPVEDSLESNCKSKHQFLEQYRDRFLAGESVYGMNSSTLVLFWHIQKSGGSSFCKMAVRSYIYSNHTKFRSQVNCGGPFNKLLESAKDESYCNGVSESAIWQHFHNQGYRVINMEPAHILGKSFPSKFHTMASYVLNDSIVSNPNSINSTYSCNGASRFWTEIVHVLAIRNPILRSLSAMTYNLFDKSGSVFDACIRHGISTFNDCLSHAINFVENEGKPISMETLLNFNNNNNNNNMKPEDPWNPVNYTSPYDTMWSENHKRIIRTQVLGSPLLDHISIDGNVENGKKILNRFHIIFDISDTEITLKRFYCFIGWSPVLTEPRVVFDDKSNETYRIAPTDISTDFQSNVNEIHRTPLLVSNLSDSILIRLKTYLAKDIELFEYAKNISNKCDNF